MNNLPRTIYLQVDPEKEIPKDFNELDGITWNKERINNTDIEYILKCKIDE